MNGVNPKITILEADVCKTTEVRCLKYSSQSAILSREWEQESSRFSTQEGRPSAFPGRGSHAGHLSEPAQRVGCVGKGAGARWPCSALPHWPARPPSRPLSRGEQGTPPSTSLALEGLVLWALGQISAFTPVLCGGGEGTDGLRAGDCSWAQAPAPRGRAWVPGYSAPSPPAQPVRLATARPGAPGPTDPAGRWHL